MKLRQANKIIKRCVMSNHLKKSYRWSTYNKALAAFKLLNLLELYVKGND